jgi:hypothetical protein
MKSMSALSFPKSLLVKIDDKSGRLRTPAHLLHRQRPGEVHTAAWRKYFMERVHYIPNSLLLMGDESDNQFLSTYL